MGQQKRCRKTVDSETDETANWIEHLDLGDLFFCWIRFYGLRLANPTEGFI